MVKKASLHVNVFHLEVMNSDINMPCEKKKAFYMFFVEDKEEEEQSR